MTEIMCGLKLTGEEQETLVIRKKPNGEIIAEHHISSEKGKLIQNRNHTRDRSKGIEELKQRLISSLKIRHRQLLILMKLAKVYPGIVETSLRYLQSDSTISSID